MGVLGQNNQLALDTRGGGYSWTFANLQQPRLDGVETETFPGVGAPFEYRTFDTKTYDRVVLLLVNGDLNEDDPQRGIWVGDMSSLDGKSWSKSFPPEGRPSLSTHVVAVAFAIRSGVADDRFVARSLGYATN